MPEERSAQAQCVAPPSSITRPNFEGDHSPFLSCADLNHLTNNFHRRSYHFVDILRRVSIVIHQHIQKCEQRHAKATEETKESGQFHISQLHKFSEENFMKPDYVYHFVRAPVSRMGFLYGIHKISKTPPPPSLQDIHTFLSDLFVKALLSAECSIGKQCVFVPDGVRFLRCAVLHLPHSPVLFLFDSVPGVRGETHGDSERAAGESELAAHPALRPVARLQGLAGPKVSRVAS